MNKYLIHVSTNWCGTDEVYPALAESEIDLWDTAEELAYDNFLMYDLWDDVAEINGYNPDEMDDNDWDNLHDKIDESDYYSWYVELFTETDEEFKSYGEPIIIN